MPIDIWAEPYSTLAFWGYVFLCVAAVWYWSYAGLFENRKKLFLSASPPSPPPHCFGATCPRSPQPPLPNAWPAACFICWRVSF